MYQTQIYMLTSEALWLILLLSAPPILLSLLAGLLVAIFQAATQIQEQTLSFTVKLVVAVLTIIATASWLSAQVYQYSINIFMNFPRWTG
jgi:type III secretion protein S